MRRTRMIRWRGSGSNEWGVMTVREDMYHGTALAADRESMR